LSDCAASFGQIALTPGRRSSASSSSTRAVSIDLCAAQEAFEPVVEDAHAQAMADQPRRHGVEHAPQNESAR
jgi:hypothetical protein